MWPKNHSIGDSPDNQSCCYREELPDADRCAWHCDPDNTENKTIEALRASRASKEIRRKTASTNELYAREIQPSYSELIDGANLRGMDLPTDMLFELTGLRDSDFTYANLSNGVFAGVDFTGATLTGTNISDSDLFGANFTCANLGHANLTSANARAANLTNAYLLKANLTNTDFSGANLTGALIEQAVLIRTNLFDANLTNIEPHGASFSDVKINSGTEIQSKEIQENEANWWQCGPFRPSPHCIYDPNTSDKPKNQSKNYEHQLNKAADTYQTIELLARDNALPSLQSQMYVSRQDVQRKRYWHKREYVEWAFARISRIVFKYGESLARIIFWAVLTIAAYAAIYTQFDLIVDTDGGFVDDPIDAIYFGTLTFTTLGFGDFQPSPASEIARILVTSQAALGAILIAIFVFVLGRRAAR